MPNLGGLSRLDQGALAGGVLTFIVSFFPWYGFSIPHESIGGVSIGGGSYTISAWHSYSTLAVLLGLASFIVLAIVGFSPGVFGNFPIGGRFLAAGLGILGALLELLRLLTLHHGDGLSIRWGGWLLLIVMIATAVATTMGALASEETKPWQQTRPQAPPI